jgi:hypothetical protein
VTAEFEKLGIHNLAYADDFCPFADAIRRELLHYGEWIEMTQSSVTAGDVFAPYNQNGITTGHLGNSKRAVLPQCMAFHDFLREHAARLCHVVALPVPPGGLQIEMNAMAYGEGCGLSPHTDHGISGAEERLVAWMLYLTDPADGEWAAAEGGALKVHGQGREILLRPRFNRFACFRVGPDSVHQIEPVLRAGGWEKCRLALSGWLRGTVARRLAAEAGETSVYLRSADYLKRREQAGKSLRGSLALYKLMHQQRTYCELDLQNVEVRIRRISRELRSHDAAPAGTSFVRHVPGPEACIIVLNELNGVEYLGSREAYVPPQQADHR